MLSLEDAIKHAEEVEKDCETAVECGIMNYLSDEENVDNISECAMEHRQLAEWLKELKRYKKYGPCAFCKHNTLEESAPCFRCPAGMSFAENVIVKVVEE